MRTVSHEIVVDTCLFSPLQMQPRWLFALSWNGLARWFKAHVCSFPELLGERGFGMVFLGIHLRYDQPFGFFDAATILQEVSVRLLRQGTRVDLVSRYSGAGRSIAEVRCLLCPVAIDEARSLAARPAPFPDPIARCFASDETGADVPARVVPGLTASVTREGTLLADDEHRFIVERHMAEVADQWSFAEIPCICENGRSALATKALAREPLLRQALAEPLRSIDVELARPYYSFDEGIARTQVHRVDGRLVWIHQLGATLPGAPVHGVIVERF